MIQPTGGVLPAHALAAAFMAPADPILAAAYWTGIGALLLTFHIYPRGKQLLALAAVVLLENLGYRQLNTMWRLIGLWRWVAQKESTWGTMKRKGDWQASTPKGS